MDNNEKLSRDCFICYYNLDVSSIIDTSYVFKLFDLDEIRSYSALYKIDLIKKCYQVEDISAYKLKYNDIKKLSEFCLKIISMDDDSSDVVTVIQSIFPNISYIDIDNIKKSLYDFCLHILNLKEEDAVVFEKYFVSKMDTYLNKLKLERDALSENYYFCLKRGWDLLKIKREEKKRGVNDIYINAKKYANIYLDMSDEQFIKIIGNFRRDILNVEYQEFVDKVLNEKNINKIIEIVSEYGYSLQDIEKIRNKLFNYIAINFMDKTYDEINNMVVLVRNKLNKYINHLEVQDANFKQQKNNEIAISWVRKFVKSNKSILEFCEINKLDDKEFNSFVKVVLKNDKKLYDEYLAVVKKRKIDYFVNLLSFVLPMIDVIKNGIFNEDGNKRKFDILDYYEYTDIDIKQMKILSYEMFKNGYLKENDYDILSDFLKKQINSLSVSGRNNLLEINFSFGGKYDNKNRLIPGTVKTVDFDEKINVLEYLDKRNIPVNNLTYVVAIRRYVNGQLFLDDTKNVKKM